MVLRTQPRVTQLSTMPPVNGRTSAVNVPATLRAIARGSLINLSAPPQSWCLRDGRAREDPQMLATPRAQPAFREEELVYSSARKK
jgi:hypothetical protein